MKKLTAAAVSLIVALFTGTGCNHSANNTQPEPVPVKLYQVRAADARQYTAYSGTIEESETIPLSFASVGTVAEVRVSEGQFVKKGQLLARLDTTTFKSAWKMANAVQQQAEDAYKRLAPMYQNGNLPEIKYIEVETGLQQAKAAAAIARKGLDDCNLYATTDALVGKRSVNPGMIALPNVSSITLVKISKVFAKVAVPEDEISLIKTGDKAMVTIGALGSREYAGTVEEVGVMADPLAHTYKIKIALANSGWKIKPGMICKVTIENPGLHQGLLAPSLAVLVDETGKNFVYVVDPATAKATRKYVQIGGMLANGLEITAGLNRDDHLVVSGQHNLVDNAAVRILPN